MIGGRRDDRQVPKQQGNWQLRIHLIGSIVVLAALLVGSSGARAQTEKQPPAEQSKAAPPAADLSGVWMADDDAPIALTTAANEEPPLTPWGLEQFKNAGSGVQAISQEGPKERKSNNDPSARCDPPGVPRVYLFDGPLEIIETPNRIFIFYEEGHHWREVWMDGRALPKNPDPTYMGYSVGRWMDDTLIVDTIGFNDKTWLDGAGHPHSDALHVVERIRRVDADTLQVTFMFDDPKAYDKPWTAAPRILKSKLGRELVESFCGPDDNRSSDKPAIPQSVPNK
jgi:hypothetical protein